MFLGISKVAEILGVEQHVVRFWETKFKFISPIRRNGRRLYDQRSLEKLKKIRELLYVRRYTIEGALAYFKEENNTHGVDHYVDSAMHDICNISNEVADIIGIIESEVDS